MKLDIAAIRKRVKVASPGPWKGDIDEEQMYADWKLCANGHVIANLGDEVDICDVEFIANARTDVPDLVEEVERLRAALKEACDALEYEYPIDDGGHSDEDRATLARLRAVLEGT